jgi:hypothetical protein
MFGCRSRSESSINRVGLLGRARLVLGGYSRLSSQPANASVSLAPKTEGSNIYFVPIGNFPRERLEPLIQYYRQKYHLEIAVVNSIPVDPATRDDYRRQLMAERLVASVRNPSPNIPETQRRS